MRSKINWKYWLAVLITCLVAMVLGIAYAVVKTAYTVHKHLS